MTSTLTPEAIAGLPHERSPLLVYVLFAESGGNRSIRKWSYEPFERATVYAYAGNGSPLGPLDSDEHVPVDQLPAALRFVAEHLFVQCERHVMEDCARIVTDAANELERLNGRLRS